jgi:hypothetical protein
MASRDALLVSSVALIARSRQAAAKHLYSSCLVKRWPQFDSYRTVKQESLPSPLQCSNEVDFRRLTRVGA